MPQSTEPNERNKATVSLTEQIVEDSWERSPSIQYEFKEANFGGIPGMYDVYSVKMDAGRAGGFPDNYVVARKTAEEGKFKVGFFRIGEQIRTVPDNYPSGDAYRDFRDWSSSTGKPGFKQITEEYFESRGAHFPFVDEDAVQKFAEKSPEVQALLQRIGGTVESEYVGNGHFQMFIAPSPSTETPDRSE